MFVKIKCYLLNDDLWDINATMDGQLSVNMYKCKCWLNNNHTLALAFIVGVHITCILLCSNPKQILYSRQLKHLVENFNSYRAQGY